MNADDWSMIIPKIVPQNAETLDDLIEVFDARHTSPGNCVFPENKWHSSKKNFRESSTVCIGVRVDGDDIDRTDLSMKLASMALEKDVVPIIFFRGDYSGMERFGFRVEKVSGETEVARLECEEQLKRFWNISVMI